MINEEINPWQVLSSEDVYDNNWIRVTHHQVINPGGGQGIYGKIHYKNLAVGILPLDENLNTWLVGQFRFVLDQYSWEIPEGGGPHDDDPLESAKRELLEETGLTANSWVEIQRMHLSNSVGNEHAIIYVARDLQQGKPQPEETEDLRIKKLPFEQVYEMVLSGEITDSITVAAVLKVKILISEGKI